MTNHCPNCGVAGLNLNCNLHFMPMFGNMTNPCKEIPLPIIDRTQAQDREKDLLAEIGRLSLQLRAAELQAHTLQAKLSDLEADGIIHGVDVGLQLRDNIIDDLMGVKPTRDPRQGLKPGDHVRFEIEGIIKERQSAGIFQDEDGNDFEPIQYGVKDFINRMTYYVGYHQITKKLGSME